MFVMPCILVQPDSFPPSYTVYPTSHHAPSVLRIQFIQLLTMHPAVTQTSLLVYECGESREGNFSPIKNIWTLKLCDLVKLPKGLKSEFMEGLLQAVESTTSARNAWNCHNIQAKVRIMKGSIQRETNSKASSSHMTNGCFHYIKVRPHYVAFCELLCLVRFTFVSLM
jgi:hypothetical protein